MDAVWSIKRKRHLLTGEIYKWKARLNIHRGQQEYSVNYFDTYAPVIAWPAIRMLMTLSILNKWKTRQIDFILAYPQAENQYEMYMRLPQGIQMRHTKEPHCLQLRRNLYGGRDTGRTFYLFMVKGLNEIGFAKSAIDECIFYRNDTIFFSYVDDGIIIAPNQDKINLVIRDLSEKFNIEDKGDINEYLGVRIDYIADNKIRLHQPHLIKQIISDLGINEIIRRSQIPAASTKILQRFKHEKPHNAKWDYRSIIGKLNFLEKSTRPDLSYSVHQCARFSSDPKISHTHAVEMIGKYLMNTNEDGFYISPDKNKSFEVFVDSDFCGNWNKLTAEVDESTSKSRTGYSIKFANCLITWGSKLQSLQGLSTTECEYMALSQALREAIPLMHLLEEMKRQGFEVYSTTPTVYCKCFEDNSGALELARLPKLRPRTKHIN